MRAALYARVSRPKAKCLDCGKSILVEDGRLVSHQKREGERCQGSGRKLGEAGRGQDSENQLIQLREYCQRQGWEIVEYIDRETAKHGEREAFKRLFEDASKRMFDVVVVWALDRFTREGVWETFDYVRKLTQHGVQFESYTEAHFRTTGPAGELMLAIAAWIAKQERLRIGERTKAGLARARKEGKQLGRRRCVFDRAKARAMRKRGMSIREIARKLNVKRSTLAEALKAA